MSAEAQARAQQCFEQIQELLRQHSCMISTALSADPVGQDSSRALITSRWGVVPAIAEGDSDEQENAAD